MLLGRVCVYVCVLVSPGGEVDVVVCVGAWQAVWLRAGQGFLNRGRGRAVGRVIAALCGHPLFPGAVFTALCPSPVWWDRVLETPGFRAWPVAA
jgi:hypothetical protein